MDDQTGSKIVGTQGDCLYLIQRADGQGQVANTSRCMLLAPQPMDSFLASGDWVRCDDVDLAAVLALVGPLARLKKLRSMIAWAVFDGRFESDDDRRTPIGRALFFAWADAHGRLRH